MLPTYAPRQGWWPCLSLSGSSPHGLIKSDFVALRFEDSRFSCPLLRECTATDPLANGLLTRRQNGCHHSHLSTLGGDGSGRSTSGCSCLHHFDWYGLAQRRKRALRCSQKCNDRTLENGFIGDPDFYGLGICLGLYLQWAVTLFMNLFLPADREAAISTSFVFSISVAAASHPCQTLPASMHLLYRDGSHATSFLRLSLHHRRTFGTSFDLQARFEYQRMHRNTSDNWRVH